jgi:superfamily II DNA or RNA helicase
MTEYKLNNSIAKKLLSYQVGNAENIVRIITENKAVLDASDTGTGKTYSAIAACAQLKMRPFVVCPKSVMSAWRRVCEYFGVEKITIVNYESIRNCKTYADDTYNRVKSPYIKYVLQPKKNKGDSDKYKFVWNVPKDCIFIFDEAHKCSDIGTLNSLLLFGAKDSGNPIMILSATIADHPEKFRLFFYILNFIEPATVEQQKLEFHTYMRIVDRWIFRDDKPMNRIHNMLYPTRATRLRIDTLGNLFPETQIDCIPYTMGKSKESEIQKKYEEIAQELDALKNKDNKERMNALVRVLRAHQKIELLKVPTFVELANDFMHDGYSVVIFVNFTKTLEMLAQMLATKCLIYGEQTAQEREKNINDFQADKQRVIICNIKAGGVGVSLHDINGKYKRASLISPTWSAIDLTQSLGRIHRAGGKSKSLQRIIFTANTVEEKIAEKLKVKLKDLNSINNGDLDLSHIIFQVKPIEM